MDIDEYPQPALYYLGLSIDAIGRADAVYFMPGWEEARGCVIEHSVCEKYGIEILDRIPDPIVEVPIDKLVEEDFAEIESDGE